MMAITSTLMATAIAIASSPCEGLPAEGDLAHLVNLSEEDLANLVNLPEEDLTNLVNLSKEDLANLEDLQAGWD